MKRLLATEHLQDAPVIMVGVDEVYHEGKLRQPPPEDRDYPRALQRLATVVKPKTLATYRPYIGAYWQLCLERELPLTDPALFRGYLLAVTRHASRRPSASTMKVVVSAINALMHAVALPSPGHDPTTVPWLAAYMRTRVQRKPHPSGAILAEHIAAAIASTEAMLTRPGAHHLRGLRDRALLLLGWTCALRRSELVAVRPQDLVQTPTGGHELVIPESKTSHGEDQVIPIVRAQEARFDAVQAMKAWIVAAQVHPSEPLFRRILRNGTVGEQALNPTAVRTILRQHGLGEEFSPHSLRSGFVTQARLNGAANHQIRTITRHKSDIMLDQYTRQVDPDRQGPGPLL